MTHELGHIECGGVGKILRWAVLVDGDQRIPIPVYERAFVNVVIMGHGIEHKKIDKAKKLIAKFRHKLYHLVALPGEPIHYETPHQPAEPPHE